ncbi:hypothetical protein mRhiFer1_009222 [Rhinolophus ferrumequinum]|uniref:Uncharacterized protein n=1 Tax=Rhinolophus ferrumequinum TaxID=59479 RepID=A0A7J7S7Y8_RHIFE|nr:hypothetical protein mRhiFer1_009222 [Rhinolophus ferrumequinum]
MEQFIRMKAQFREAYEERCQEWEARSAWETRASGWHTTLLAVEGVTFLLVVCCCCRLRGLWTSYTEAITHSDTWHGEQDSGQVGMVSDSGQEDMWPPHSVWYQVASVLRSWNPGEGWEDVDGSWASVERALQVLAEQLLEEAKATTSCVGWMFLTALSLNMENALNEIAQVQDHHPRWEALEARDHQLEEFLTTLCHKSGEALIEAAQVQDLQSLGEMLEAWVLVLEEELHSGDSEAEADDTSGSDVAPDVAHRAAKGKA